MSKEDMSVLWAFAGSLWGLKLVTSILILYHFPSWHTFMLVVMLSVLWIIPPICYMCYRSPGRYRLLRGRLRRGELLRQEWEVEEHSTSRRS